MTTETLPRPIRDRTRLLHKNTYIHRDTKPNERSPTPDEAVDIQIFIEQLGEFYSSNEEETKQFIKGAKYAEEVLGFLYNSGSQISKNTLREFLISVTHENRQTRDFDCTQILEKKQGKMFLLTGMLELSLLDSDLVNHFSLFENQNTKLGAMTVLHLFSKDIEQNSKIGGVIYNGN